MIFKSEFCRLYNIVEYYDVVKMHVHAEYYTSYCQTQRLYFTHQLIDYLRSGVRGRLT